ncbi:MAG TPA: hypothetical protein VMY76_17165 [Gemmatimonadales bacterium]|nr:hypothetical protein [Gemmatimonadales bacterium]
MARRDQDAVSEYLFRVRQANPGLGESVEQLQAQYSELARRILDAPLDRYLADGDESAYLDLRVTLILLAVHEGFSGFIMTGEAADFVASVMAPHKLMVCDAEALIGARNQFVRDMGQEMSYWAAWPELAPDGLPPVAPPTDPDLQRLLRTLIGLPLGARAHAVDAIRHLSAHAHIPKTLASLSRYETRKRGLDVAASSQLILESGIVVPATDLDGWLSTWTRRDLLGFLAQSGVGARNSWGKERLAEVAKTECGELLRARMAEAGVVELAPEHVEGARLLREHVESTRECWRVWLAFGTGVA